MVETGAADTIQGIRSNKVRMYLREIEKLKHAKAEVERISNEAKKRRAAFTGGEWGQAQRLAVQFDLTDALV